MSEASQTPAPGRSPEAPSGAQLKRPTEVMSISAFARATGVPAETIRSWERRYGQPVPLRLPSGHRRYQTQDVERIRMVAALIESGKKPSKLLRASLEELREALPGPIPMDETVSKWMEFALQFNASGLRRALVSTAAQRELIPFLHDCLGPFLWHLGEAWESQRLTVGQEHCASETVGEVLHQLISEVRGERAIDSTARAVIVGLPGERHGLVLQMLELVARDAGANAWNLGVNCPTESLVAAARQVKATHVLLHISAANAGLPVDHALRRLADALSTDERGAEIEIIAGGAGAQRSRRAINGVTFLSDLSELRKRLQGWREVPA